MICVDASLIVRAVTDEDGSKSAQALLKSWQKSGEFLVAPALLDYEVAAALNRKAFLQDLEASEALNAYRIALTLGIGKKHEGPWMERAMMMANTFNKKSLYDFVYLVCAEEMRAELFTADHAFYQMVQAGYPFVKYYL